MLHGPLPQRLREHSDHEQLKTQLDFKWERFHRFHTELMPLFKQHWREIALDRDLVPLDPDWDWYLAADQQQLLHVLTARSRWNGKLAGYIFNIIGPHNHYKSTRFANTEMFYLHPYFRKGWQPVRMFKENIRGLETLGAQVAVIYFKLGFKDARVGTLLARLGYMPTDIVCRKILA